MRSFPTTVWTVIRAAGTGRETAQRDLFDRYRPAVVQFARFKGVEPSEAEDVAQEVFLRLFEDAVLDKADAARGRFRNLVLAVTRHVLGHHFGRSSALKRGGGVRRVSLDQPGADELVASKESDPDFDREWLAALLARALERVKRENPGWYDCLHGFVVEEKSQRELATELGKTESAVRNAIYRGRARLAAVVEEEVAAYASSSDEFETEVGMIEALLGNPPGEP